MSTHKPDTPWRPAYYPKHMRDKNEETEPETLPDMSATLASMGRGSMQRRIDELERLLLEVEYTSSFLDRSPFRRMQEIRNRIHQARLDGIVTKQPK